jgi:threonine aldolase
LEVHHIQERAKGGGNELRNLVVLCDACHDKHHAGEIEVGGLVLTSDGMERSTVSLPPKAKKSKWTEEEMETILSTIQVHKGRPLTRTINALQEHGITITAAQLRKIM